MRSEDGRTLARPTGPPPGQQALVAAVLVLVYPGPEGLTVALTRRTSHLSKHAGQISFPGGRMDSSDTSLLQTALREAREELGADVSGLSALVELHTVYIPPSNFLVHPFVVCAEEPPAFVPSAGEVAEVLEVPLRHLMDPANLLTEVRELKEGRCLVPYFRFGPHRIWGATATILDDLISRIEAGLRV